MDPPLLEIDGLGHRFGTRLALDGLSFEVDEGEVLGLLGPNGSGKSTALAILAGVLPRQTGGVRFRGRSVTAQPRWWRQQLGVVFQSPSLDLLLTGRQNLCLAAAVHGIGRREANRRADRSLEQVGLRDRADEPAANLSGGMRRRLDLARALLHGPSLLLMDEPTAGLDEASFQGTWATLERLCEDRLVTVIVATHRAEEAERCHRVAVLAEGRLALVDTPAGLRSRVGEDVLVLVGDEPEVIRSIVAAELDRPALVVGHEVLVECERGHELIPRLVEALTAARLASVALRRPSLADAFLKLTGRTLDDLAVTAEGEEEAA